MAPTHCSPLGERRQKPRPKRHPGDPGERRWVALTTGQLQPELWSDWDSFSIMGQQWRLDHLVIPHVSEAGFYFLIIINSHREAIV